MLSSIGFRYNFRDIRDTSWYFMLLSNMWNVSHVSIMSLSFYNSFVYVPKVFFGFTVSPETKKIPPPWDDLWTSEGTKSPKL